MSILSSKKFFVLIIISLLFIIYELFIPINNFPIDKTFNINRGESEDIILQRLFDEGYVKNLFFTKFVSRVLFDSDMQIGKFTFTEPVSMWSLLLQLRQKPKSIKITIPEGFTVAQAADRLDIFLNTNNITIIKNFDKKYFLESVDEGYIFPETYYFQMGATTAEVINILNLQYNRSISSLNRKPSKEEIIIASMLQREVIGEQDMKIVSGIIRNRLKIGMPLQIDATVLYGQGKWKSRVLYKDLKDESSYNTYKNKGLPIGPISNPGLVALDAALNPTKTKYLFYLTGRDGITYFAETGERHIKNINLYLR